MSDHELERIEVSADEIRFLLERVKAGIAAEDFELLEKVVRSFLDLSRLVEKKGMTIHRLRKLLFGSKSEKLRHIFPDDEKPEDVATNSSTLNDDVPQGGTGEEPAKAKKPKAKGHGRNSAAAYTGADQNRVSHPSLEPGDPCPESGCKGKVYEFEPLVFVRVSGQAPLGATVHTIEQLRCNLCLKLFPACSPEEFGAEKYDTSAASMIAILTYGTGLPFNRLEGLQRNLGIPLPASTQWDIVERAEKLVAPAYDELIRQGAQGDVLHNDDTPAKILEYMEKKERRRDAG
jgi:transposase